YARTSLPADFGKNLGNAVRDNPIPIALIGVGLAWLMAQGQRGGGMERGRRYDPYASDSGIEEGYEGGYGLDYSRSDLHGGTQGDRMHDMAERAAEAGRDAKERVSGASREAMNRMSETGHQMADKAGEMGHRISDAASGMMDRVRHGGEQMRSRMQGSGAGARARMEDLGHRSQEQYYRARDSISHLFEDQPLVLGALGIAIGAALGAALPPTRREDEMLGRTRDDMLDRAKEVGREEAEHVKESARRVAETAKQEGQRVAQDTQARAQGNGHAKEGANPSSPSSGGPGQPSIH
ncbi:MAG TPA: hypothetical protein VM406_05745, partial [Noviherbaspirillum sp.]|nr:hypothetical protein [Noviherbaspirillum sp.]